VKRFRFRCLRYALLWQQPSRTAVVGILAFAAGADDPIVRARRLGLHELRYVEGRGVRFEFRTAQGYADRGLHNRPTA
jgi:hypothetical protein